MIIYIITCRPFGVSELGAFQLSNNHETQVNEALDGLRSRLFRGI